MEVSVKLYLSVRNWIKPVVALLLILLPCPIIQGCDKTTITGKGANIPMQTYYIGRFSIAVPVEMKVATRGSTFRYAEITEILWPKIESNEQTRTAEWNNLMAEIRKLTPPYGKNKVIIRAQDFPGVGKWAKGVYYYYDKFDNYDGRWALLMDAGPVGVWFKGESIVEKEIVGKLLERNIEASGKTYTYIERHLQKSKALPQGDWFYLGYGAINRPYRSQEESHTRFASHRLNLVMTVDMKMDFRHKIETMGLIEKTRGMLAAAALETGGSMSKIRLSKREVAGMNGEESILRITEDSEKTLMFTWEFNGKEDSGDYPTTTIEMEAPDGKLDEKIAIWDAVLDSMKPMFERKK